MPRPYMVVASNYHLFLHSVLPAVIQLMYSTSSPQNQASVIASNCHKAPYTRLVTLPLMARHMFGPFLLGALVIVDAVDNELKSSIILLYFLPFFLAVVKYACIGSSL